MIDAMTGAAPWLKKKMEEDVDSAMPMPTKKVSFTRGSTGDTGKKQGMGFPESKKKGFPNPIDGGMPEDAPETGKSGDMSGSDTVVNKDLINKTIEKTFAQDREDTLRKFAGNSGVTPPYIKEQLDKMRSSLIAKYGKDAFTGKKFKFKYDSNGSIEGVYDEKGEKLDLSNEGEKKTSFMSGGTVGSKEKEGSDMEDSPEVEIEIEAGSEKDVTASPFEKIKEIEGADADLIDRANEVLAKDVGDEAEYKAELKSVIADVKASKDSAKASNSEELAMAYGEMLMSLEEFATELSGMQQDVAMFKGRKMTAVMGKV